MFAVGLYELWRLFFAAFLLLFFFFFLVLVPCGSESLPLSSPQHPTPSHPSRPPRPHPNPLTTRPANAHSSHQLPSPTHTTPPSTTHTLWHLSWSDTHSNGKHHHPVCPHCKRAALRLYQSTVLLTKFSVVSFPCLALVPLLALCLFLFDVFVVSLSLLGYSMGLPNCWFHSP